MLKVLVFFLSAEYCSIFKIYFKGTHREEEKGDRERKYLPFTQVHFPKGCNS